MKYKCTLLFLEKVKKIFDQFFFVLLFIPKIRMKNKNISNSSFTLNNT